MSNNNIINIAISILGTDTVDQLCRSIIHECMVNEDSFVFRGDGTHVVTTTTDSFVQAVAKEVFTLGNEHASQDHVEAASLLLFGRYIPDTSTGIVSDAMAVIYVQSVTQMMHGTPSFNDPNIYRGIYLCVMGIIRRIIQACCEEILEKRGVYITKVPRRVNPSIYSHLKSKYAERGLDFRTFITPPITGDTRYVTAGLLITTMDLLRLPKPMQLGEYCSKTLGQGGWVSLNGLPCEEDVQIELSQYNILPQQTLKDLLGDHPIHPRVEGDDQGVSDSVEVEGVGRDVSVLDDPHGYSELDESSLEHSEDDSDYDDTSSSLSKNSMLDSELDLDLSQYVNEDIDDDVLKEDDSSHESDGDVYQW